jgi:hypothetical protein
MSIIGNSWLEDEYYSCEGELEKAEHHVLTLAEMLLPMMKDADIGGTVRMTENFKKLRNILLYYGKDIDDDFNIVLSAEAIAEQEEQERMQKEIQEYWAKRRAEEDARLAELAARPVVGVKLTDNPVEWNNKVPE